MEVRSEKIIIRPYRKEDRPRLRAISVETAFFGMASVFVDDEVILADSLTMYFTDYEPQSCFVAEFDGEVVGYLIGALNVHRMNMVSAWNIFPRLFMKAVGRGLFGRKKVFRFLVNCLMSYFKGEFFMPDFARSYPATFHINMNSRFRGKGTGHRLIEAFVGYLKEHHVPGVYVSTFTDSASKFFESAGFKILFTRPRSYMRYRLGRDSQVYMLGKKLDS